MVDLAGMEGPFIDNIARVALGNCLSAIALGRNVFPFEGSTLTLLLKDVLGPPCKTVLIANTKLEAEAVPLPPFKRFCKVIWYKILSHLEDPRDIVSVSRSCLELNRLVKRILPPLRLVLAHVIPHMSKSDILACRQVSRRICSKVDDFLARHPFKTFMDGRMPTNWIAAGYISKIYQYQTSGVKRKPFVGRTFSLTENELSLRSNFGILKHSLIQDHIWHINVNLGENRRGITIRCLFHLLSEIFSSVRHIKSILVEGVISCEGAWVSDMKTAFPLLSHAKPISVEFRNKTCGRHSFSYNTHKLLIFNAYHGQLLKFELNLKCLTKFLPLYRCEHLTVLKLVGLHFDDVLSRLTAFEAPLLRELSLVLTFSLNWEEKRSFQAGGSWEEISITRLGSTLRRFTNLRVLKIENVDLESTILQLEDWDWVIINRAVFAVPNQNLQLNGNNVGLDHEGMVWYSLPPQIKEFHLGLIFYSHRPQTQPHQDSNGWEVEPRYPFRRYYEPPHPQQNFTTWNFKRGQSRSKYQDRN